MRRLIFGILSACLFVASLVLCVGSLHKPLVLTYHGFGGTVVYSFDGALCLASAHNFSASSVGRFGYPTESTNTIKLLNLWIVALFATLAFGLSLWYSEILIADTAPTAATTSRVTRPASALSTV